MEITTSTEGSARVLHVKGRVDGLSAPQLDEALQNAIRDKHYKLIVDVSGTEFMSSAGMRALLKARTETQDKKGDLRLAGASHYLLESLKLVGFDKLFKMFDSPAEAGRDF